jgi:integrase
VSRGGSLKRSGDGWGFIVDAAAPGATRRQIRKRGFATKKAAQEALTELLAGVQQGTFVAPTRVLVGRYLEDWLESLVIAGRRPTTIAGYRGVIDRYLLPTLGEVPLQQLTALDLDRLYGRLVEQGGRGGRPLSLRTIRYAHSVIGKALGDAERKGLVIRNVARLASPPTSSAARPPEMKVWTPAELRAFLDQTTEHPHGAMFRIAAMTGLRRGELCGLRWSDLDLDAARLQVRRSITAVGRRLVEGDVKTARSRRVVDIDTDTVATLRSHRAGQLQERLLVGPGWQARDLVFADPAGSPWHPDTISQAFDRAVARSGLPRIRFHDLRHGHASHLLVAGINAKIVSERLGHASVAFTLDTYAHVIPGQQADAAAAVAKLIQAAGADLL